MVINNADHPYRWVRVWCAKETGNAFFVYLYIYFFLLSSMCFLVRFFAQSASPSMHLRTRSLKALSTSSNSILRCSKMIHDDDSQRIANFSRNSLNLSSDKVALWNKRVLLKMLISPNPSWKNNFDPRCSSQITKLGGILPFSKRLVFVIIVLFTRVLTCSVQREFSNNIYYSRRSMILRRRTYRPRWVPISYKIFATSIPIYLKLICDEIRWNV